MVPANVPDADELAQELLWSAVVLVNTVPSSKVPVTTGGGSARFAAGLDKVKVRIAELESAETITVRRD